MPGDALRAVNVYAIEADDHIVLVDAGWAREEAWTALADALRRIGAGVGDVRHVLVTHIHHDHYGQAPRIRSASGGSVALGEGERESFEILVDAARRDQAWERDAVRVTAAGAPELAEEMLRLRRADGGIGSARWELPDTWLVDAADVAVGGRRLEVIATPGHTRGHVSLADRGAGVLYAGDHVLPRITPSIGLEADHNPWALIDFLRSLAAVRDLPVTRVLPAHGADFEGLATRVDELLEHHAVRLQRCIDAVAPHGRTALEVARRLPWTRRETAFDDLDLWNRWLALNETVAHLILLVAQGSLARTQSAGVDVYTVAAAG